MTKTKTKKIAKLKFSGKEIENFDKKLIEVYGESLFTGEPISKGSKTIKFYPRDLDHLKMFLTIAKKHVNETSAPYYFVKRVDEFIKLFE